MKPLLIAPRNGSVVRFPPKRLPQWSSRPRPGWHRCFAPRATSPAKLGPDRIAFVEWPVQDSAELASARVHVTLTHMGADRRRIEVAEG